jgi:hypothetical protein
MYGWHVVWVYLTAASVCLCVVLKKRKVEDHGDFILGPVSPKEYKDTVAELDGSRTNRVFDFFKVTAPESIGFAKHCEAAERKAAALTTAGADTAETMTSPCAGGAPSKKTTKRTNPATAAMAAAEGKPRRNGAPGRRAHLRQPRRHGSSILIPALWGPSLPSRSCALLHLREVVVERLAVHCLCR